MNLECKTMDINKKTMKYVNENTTQKIQEGQLLLTHFVIALKALATK